MGPNQVLGRLSRVQSRSSNSVSSPRHWLGQTDPNIQAIAQRAAQDVETQHMVPPERSRRFELMVRPRLWE